MQVLAITGNASLVVALGSMMRDWEVVTVRTADEAFEQGTTSMVALIDMGETNQGVEIADDLYRRGLVIPGVVIGDVPAEHPRIDVLVRPFSLEDLSVAVRGASQRPAAAPTPEPAVPPAPEPQAPPAAAAPPAPPAPPSEKQQRQAPASAPAAQSAAPAAATSPEPAVDEPVRTAPKPPPPEPPSKRALSVVRPLEEEKVEPSAPAPEPEPDVPEPPAPEPDVPEPPLEESPAVEAPEPAVEEPAVRHEAPVVEPARQEPIYEPAVRAPVIIPSPVFDDPQSGRRRLLRRPVRQQPPVRPVRPAASVASPEEPPMVKQLKQAVRNLKDLESLLVELPFLDDLRSMADALVSEVQTQFDPQTAAVFIPAADGFQPIAHRGLSRVESGMVVPATQPLFSDVISTKDGILIQPVDLAQGLVAGIGGARTEALMAAPAVLDGEVVSIVVVGSERFDETDLDRLSEIAAEAAPGIAVAVRVQELRNRGGSV